MLITPCYITVLSMILYACIYDLIFLTYEFVFMLYEVFIFANVF